MLEVHIASFEENRPHLQKLGRSFENAQALCEHLLKAGFKAELLKNDDSVFSNLRFPRSFGVESNALTESYTYLKDSYPRKNRQDKVWGLILLDDKSVFGENQKAHNVIYCDFPDAAMDEIIRKSSLEEWAGKNHLSDIFEDCAIEENVHIGPNCEIGRGSIIESGVRIGAGVHIGANTRIGAGTRICDYSWIGDNCQLTGMDSIGSCGFGLVRYPRESGLRPRRHVGRVFIGNNVRLGAFVAVDRGVFEDTVVMENTSVDNFVHIGHNCRVGQNNVICGFVGLSGSTIVGDRVTFAGISGTKGHLSIGNDVTVAAQSGVTKDIPSGAGVIKGWPARPLAEALKLEVLIGQLPEMNKRLKEITRND